MMKTTILAQKETPLTLGSKSKIETPQYVRIDCIQLSITCGPNMLGKSIGVTFFGQDGETLTIEKVDLTEMHNLLVDTEIDVLKDSRWPVKYIEVQPLQNDNWPIFIGINSLNLP